MNNFAKTILILFIILPIFHTCRPPHDGEDLYRILVNGKYGFINEHGDIVIEPQFDETSSLFYDEVCFAKQGERIGLINKSGLFIANLPDSIKSVGEFTKGVAVCTDGNRKYGVINKKGEVIVPMEEVLVSIYEDRNNVFILVNRIHRTQNNGGNEVYYDYDDCYVFDENGKRIGETYSDAGIFENGLCIIEQNDSYGVMDTQGNIVIDCIYDDIWKFSDKLFCVEKNEKYGFIDIRGNNVVEPVYEDVDWKLSSGRCWVAMDGKEGYIDETGNIVINALYDSAYDFTEDGIAHVKKGGRYLFINENGEELFSVDSVLTSFHCDRAAVIIEGEKSLMDRKGRIICQIDADEISPFDPKNHLAIIKKDGYSYLIDKMGKECFPSRYESISLLNDCAIVYKDEKAGVIDTRGNVMIDAIYEYIHLDKKSKVFIAAKHIGRDNVNSYYDLKGNLLWTDIVELVKSQDYSVFNITRENAPSFFEEYFSSLDPIEGIYYVTTKSYYQNRDQLSQIGLNESSSSFYIILSESHARKAYASPSVYTGMTLEGDENCIIPGARIGLPFKFDKIGEGNKYAIVNDDNNNGVITLDDPYHFSLKMEQGHNNWYNFFETYEFVKDYPAAYDYGAINQAEWSGSGFAITDGFVATNYHVVKGAKTIRIRGIDGDIKKSFNAALVASDKEHDVAIIRIIDKGFSSFGRIPYKIGNAKVEVGDDVFVLGYPLTTTMGEEIKLTNGIISSATGYKGDESMFQTTAAVQPGNSGGPLFDSSGCVIGLISGKHEDAENANYAVKVAYLYRLINDAELGIDISHEGNLKKGKLSSKVKRIKDYVYLIECHK